MKPKEQLREGPRKKKMPRDQGQIRVTVQSHKEGVQEE